LKKRIGCIDAEVTTLSGQNLINRSLPTHHSLHHLQSLGKIFKQGMFDTLPLTVRRQIIVPILLMFNKKQISVLGS
jgi:hypothetical protein